MAVILAILQHTPWWVWLLLGALTALGLQASRPRRIRVVRALATPLVFVGWGLVSLAAHLTLGVLAAWLVAAAVGSALGLTTTHLDGMRADSAQGLVALPGSWLPLARNLAIFAARYVLAVAAARMPAAHDQLVLWDLAVSGLSAGYFIGWLTVFIRRYRRTSPPAQSSTAAVAP
ncbi:MAG TPA: DUF6622 family protein [Candidatus Sulfotelmatobacter sp.]|nr:DUF6622 family protein [Candidatus Sulfotelmatobacter sp.]